MQVLLTEEFVEQATCPDEKKYIEYCDIETQGLILRVNQGGKKTYAIRCRKYEGKVQLKKTIGKVEDIKFDNIRKIANGYIKQYAAGGNPLDPIKRNRSAGVPTLEEVYENWCAWEKKQAQTRRNCTHSSYLALKDLYKVRISNIDKAKIEKYQAEETLAGKKASTINRKLRELKYLCVRASEHYDRLKDYQYPKYKQLSEIGIEPRIQEIPEDDRNKIIAAALEQSKETYTIGDKKRDMGYLHPLIVLMIYTGIRPVTALGLIWRDIDLKKKKFLARHTNNRKAKTTCWLYLSEAPYHALKDWKDKNPNAKPDDRLFPVSSIKKQFKSVLRRAGIDEKKYSPYSLRHGFAMLLAEKGADPLQLQNALTHADFRTTQHYIDAQEERQRAAMALLD